MRRPVNPLDRFLRLFADVREGESTTVLLLALNVFLILTSYYFIKPVREALILEGGGPEWKSYSAAGQALLLVAAVPLYGALATRMPRRRLINVVTIFFAACLALFYLASLVVTSGLALAIVFYLWVGIFNLMIVAQFWAFANDIYTAVEGERLFPIVAFGASAGAVFGSFISGGIIEWIGLAEPLIAAALLLLLSLLVTNFVDTFERRRKEAGLPDPLTTGTLPAATGGIRVEDIRRALEGTKPDGADREAEPRDIDLDTLTGGLSRPGPGPFAMVFRCRYLLFIALLMLLANWVNTTGEYLLGSIVDDTAASAVATGTAGGLTEGQYIGAFYSSFFGFVNVAGLVLQAFVVSRIVKYLGVQIGLLVLPVIALGVYSLIFFYPILSYVRWAKTAENATDYSLQNTVRNMLFLPCTREQKYKAKQVIDAFFVRAGDVMSAVVVYLGTTFLAAQVKDFALFNVLLVLGWLTLAVLIGREYRQLVASDRPPCV
jgi:AAA family ATP:ADP antiporter